MLESIDVSARISLNASWTNMPQMSSRSTRLANRVHPSRIRRKAESATAIRELIYG